MCSPACRSPACCCPRQSPIRASPNLPPQAGVIALLAGLVCYGLFGRSRFAIVSATSSSAAVLAAGTLAIAGPGAHARAAVAATLVLLTGAVFLIAGAARLGGLSQSDRAAGAARLRVRTGLRDRAQAVAAPVRRAAVHGDFMPLLAGELLKSVGRSAAVPRIATGIVALLLLFLASACATLAGQPAGDRAGRGGLGLAGAAWRRADRCHRSAADLGRADVAIAATSGCPASNWRRPCCWSCTPSPTAPSAALPSSMATRSNPNRDLLVLGVANALSGLLHGMPVGAGYSGTSANEAAGARSRLVGPGRAPRACC